MYTYIYIYINKPLARIESGGIEKGGMKFQSPSARNEYRHQCYVRTPLFQTPPFRFGEPLSRTVVTPPDMKIPREADINSRRKATEKAQTRRRCAALRSDANWAA